MASIPQHVAVIPDGNRRWARERGLAPMEGHRLAYDRLFDVAEAVVERGVKYLTFYAFSTENWKRAQSEVGFLLSLLERFLQSGMDRYIKAGYRLRFLGSKVNVSQKLLDGMVRAEAQSAHNDRAVVSICFNYGGRQDLIEAVQGIVRAGVAAEAVDETVIAEHLSSQGVPPPDLIVRTSGEQRLSNYLLWEAAYAELMFLDCYWPDFGEAQIDQVLAEYSRRQRRYGS